MCGIFGVWSERMIHLGSLMHDGLLGLQHRGQEGTGLMMSDGSHVFHSRRISSGNSSVRHFFEKTDVSGIKARSAIGHNRYSTAGSVARPENQQPLVRHTKYGLVGIAHNGTLLDVNWQRGELLKRGYSFQSDSDTEIILGYLSFSEGEDFASALIDSLRNTRGAYSLLAMNEHELIAVRDSFGFRPLSFCVFDHGYLFSSETCAFGFVGKQYEIRSARDVKPGEVLIVNKNGLTSLRPFNPRATCFCVFELIYFARPDSEIFGRYAFEFRMNLGREHAKEGPISADCVVGIPDSANYFADGLAEGLKIPHRHALVRSHYAARTFISPDGLKRSDDVRLKLAPVRPLVEGQRIALADDSIVRGSTSKKTVSMLRACDPRSIAFCVGCPPLIGHCPYGIDIKTSEELIANKKTVEEICRFIGADDLRYLSLDSLKKVAGENFCYGCFTGEYPVLGTDRE